MLPLNMSLTATKATCATRYIFSGGKQAGKTHFHVSRKERPAFILAARDKHEHVITGTFQLTEMGVERDGTYGSLVAADFSVGRQVCPVADAANV
jgi:hypothetical protein